MRVEIVLDQEGRAEEGSGVLPRGKRTIDRIGAFERPGIYFGDRVEAAGTVVRFDPIQVSLDHHPAARAPLQDRGVQVRDRGFHDFNGMRGGRNRSARRQASGGENRRDTEDFAVGRRAAAPRQARAAGPAAR